MSKTDPLLGLLQTASLYPLLTLVSGVLSRSGFHDVRIMGRRLPEQKSHKGGYEILAQSVLSTHTVKVVVKVIRDEVRLRMLDELAGVVAREGADYGILATPFQLSPKMRAAQEHCTRVRVEVLDGDALAILLRQQGTGVRKGGEPDYAFFTSLEEYSSRLMAFVDKEGL